MKRAYIFALSLVVFALLPASATIINIPDDYPTIQEGIDASTDGDTVLVQPGTYVENINFSGHNIVLGSLFLTTWDTSFIHSTIISESGPDGNVAFENGEDSTTAIIGFTIRDGNAIEGAGICCYNSGPIIRNNVIKNNRAEGGDSGGGGIACINSSPLIECNVIYGNYGYLAGGGIGCRNNSNPRIINNTIYENSTGPNYGGGGLVCINSNPQVANTIFWENEPQSILGNEPFVSYCNVEGGWDGEGNIDVDPLFRDPENSDFHLMSTACGDPYDSPCIDAGHPDILDSLLDCSWGLGELRSDIGAYGGGDSVTVGIDQHDIPIPQTFSLSRNYPNPFNTMTIIRYSLPEPADVKIEIFDILGRKVETLIEGEQPPGYHQTIWNAEERSSGMYFYRIEAGEYSDTRKMVLLK